MGAEEFHRRGIATDHDVVVADALADVLSGGAADLVDTVNEDQLLALERAAFMRLMKTAGTLARIEHLLVTGKPLRN
jgi:3-hydroxyacyl-CoA dehydrogenase